MVRGYEQDHEPDGWPAIKQKHITAMANEIERLGKENEELRKSLWAAMKRDMAAMSAWYKNAVKFFE
jgi:hypothetical protein